MQAHKRNGGTQGCTPTGTPVNLGQENRAAHIHTEMDEDCRVRIGERKRE